jgi:hypothetical protein
LCSGTIISCRCRSAWSFTRYHIIWPSYWGIWVGWIRIPCIGTEHKHTENFIQHLKIIIISINYSIGYIIFFYVYKQMRRTYTHYTPFRSSSSSQFFPALFTRITLCYIESLWLLAFSGWTSNTIYIRVVFPALSS